MKALTAIIVLTLTIYITADFGAKAIETVKTAQAVKTISLDY